MIKRVLYSFPGLESSAPSTSEDGKNKDRVPTDDWNKANLVSSYCIDMPDFHAPVIDIDNKGHIQDHVEHTYKAVAEIYEFGYELFGVHPQTYKIIKFKSRTLGHYHLYVEKKLRWIVYRLLLLHLWKEGFVEQGYMSASIERGATFVRMPARDADRELLRKSYES